MSAGADAKESMSYRVPLRDESDITVARRHVRELGQKQRLRPAAIEALATAVSEVARNVIVHGHAGEVFLGLVDEAGRQGVIAIARDEGPGIADVDAAMQDGFSTGKSLGLGLPSARRLVDVFELRSAVGEGTTVSLTKWRADRDGLPG